jgi:DNA mismatch endonuclease (patch repair protein)
MARIRGKNTRPERLLRGALHRMGVRFRLHRKDLPGRPDIVVPRYHAVIFVHGCFWHRHRGCVLAYQPKTRVAFWNRKFEENLMRDRGHAQTLGRDDWRVGVVWECSLRAADKRMGAASELVDWLRSRRPRIEIPAPSRSTPGRAMKEPGPACGRRATRVGRQPKQARESMPNTKSSSI